MFGQVDINRGTAKRGGEGQGNQSGQHDDTPVSNDPGAGDILNRDDFLQRANLLKIWAKPENAAA